jgi:hypothetical protein
MNKIMKKIRPVLVILVMFIAGSSYAQNDWSTVDFTEEYKGNFKINGKTAKSLKQNKTFIAGYGVSQAIVMKGSATSSALQSGNQKSVFAEASLEGVEKDAYQQMVDELYKEFIDGLSTEGITITDGEDVLATKYAQKKRAKGDKKDLIKNMGKNPSYEGEKAFDANSIYGYTAGAGAVLRDLTFPPQDKNVYLTTKKIYGNFYQGLADTEGFNLMFVNFYVSFASFDGGNGYKDVKLSTKPIVSVRTTVTLINPKGYADISYNKEVWGSTDWVAEMGKTKDNQLGAEFWGLARSTDYSIVANSDPYLSEVRSIISNWQKDIIKGIKGAL